MEAMLPAKRVLTAREGSKESKKTVRMIPVFMPGRRFGTMTA